MHLLLYVQHPWSGGTVSTKNIQKLHGTVKAKAGQGISRLFPSCHCPSPLFVAWAALGKPFTRDDA